MIDVDGFDFDFGCSFVVVSPVRNVDSNARGVAGTDWVMDRGIFPAWDLGSPVRSNLSMTGFLGSDSDESLLKSSDLPSLKDASGKVLVLVFDEDCFESDCSYLVVCVLDWHVENLQYRHD